MEIDRNVQHKMRIVIFGLLISGALFCLEFFSFLGLPRNTISYLYNPLAFAGGGVGSNLRAYLSLFTDISNFKNDYNALKIRNLELEVFENYNQILVDENESLKRQIKLGNKNAEYVISQIVYGGTGQNQLDLNVGSNAGVSSGDVAVLGNVYVGLVTEADVQGSTLRLASSSASNLRVLIVRNKNLENVSIENIAEKYISEKSIRAVAIGTGEEIRLENIPVDSQVKSGDSIVVADERVGEYLLLGRIKDVDKDLAATTVTASVDQLLDYDVLTNIFVRIKK